MNGLGRRLEATFLAVVDATSAPQTPVQKRALHRSADRFNHWLQLVPGFQVFGINAILFGFDLVALMFRGKRFRRLDRAQREALLRAIERTPAGGLVGGVITASRFAYESDLDLMASYGCDLQAKLTQAAHLRESEGRL